MSITKHNEKLTKQTAHGVFWNYFSYFLSKIFALITLAILAHLLNKDDFGIVAAATIVTSFLYVFKDLGLELALIRRKENIEEASNTVFTLNCVMGLMLSLLIFSIAPLVSTYFDEPELRSVLSWLGISFFINALGSVHIVLLKRELDFRRKFFPDIGAALIKGIISISMAVNGFGVWSLVVGQLAGSVVGVIIIWRIFPWRPELTFNKSLAYSMFQFGGAIIGMNILAIMIGNLPLLIIGKTCGMAMLGVFLLAYRLPEILVMGNLSILAAVTFPAFSKIQDSRTKLNHGFLATVRLVSMMVIPICLGLIIAAEPIIIVLFGYQWLDAIPIMQALALYVWLGSIG